MQDRASVAEILDHVPIVDHTEDRAADLVQRRAGWLHCMRIGCEIQPIHLLRNTFRHGTLENQSILPLTGAYAADLYAGHARLERSWEAQDVKEGEALVVRLYRL